jgi:hypothetical protein
MAVSFRSITQVGSASSTTTLTINKPSGVVSGDVLVAIVTLTSGRTVTAPSGWTKRGESPGQVFIYTKTAGSSEPSSYTWTASSSVTWGGGAIAAYQGGVYDTSASAEDTTADSTLSVPAVASTKTGRLVHVAGWGTGSVNDLAAPSGETERTNDYRTSFIADRAITATGTQAATGFSGVHDLPAHGASIVIANPNVAPNAPIITAPADGATIDRNITQRFDWDFSDPDAGDSQSKYDLRYRVSGTSTWTTITGTTPNTYHDFAAGTFTAGDYEWQVRTYDAQGVVGPYSGSSFFTAGDAPPEPTITAPVSGGTVSETELVEWSTPDQDSYQLRRVADNAGTADTSTVYYDTGEVVSATARSRSVTFETNNRYEHIQVRIKDGGLWSSWASIRVQVSYTPPPAPVVSLLADDDAGALIVTITNPEPGVDEPAVNYNDVYVNDGAGEQRLATLVPPNSSWTFWLPKAGREYDGNVRVVSVADNGITNSS